MLMKLTPGINFINVLQAAFTPANPESAKRKVKLSVFFPLLGSASAKAARRMLVKLTPGRVGHRFVGVTECCKNYDCRAVASRFAMQGW